MSPKPLRTYLDALAPVIVAVHGGRPDLPITTASDDSRRVTPGSLFVARPGQHTDGSKYIPDAWRRGALAVVTEREPETVPPGCAWIRVTNAARAAAIAAETCWDRPADRLTFAAVTGTNGKTTTAFLLAHILERTGRRTGLIGTVCCRAPGIDLPAGRTTPFPFEFQAILRKMADAGTEVVVLEASSHGLIQDRLGSLKCRVAGFTNLTGDHLDYHRTMEEYYRAKRLLFTRHLRTGSAACIDVDDPYGKRLAAELDPGVRVVTFGRPPGAAWRVRVRRADLDGVLFELHPQDGPPIRLATPLIGRFQAWNCALAALMALHMDDPPPVDAVIEAVREFRGAPGRMQVLRSRSGRLAVVDYAHTDDALDRALAALREIAGAGRLIVTFGCGGDRDRTKRPRMGRVAASRADHVILTSDNPRSEDPLAIIREIRRGMPADASVDVEPDRRNAIRRALAIAGAGDVVLVAGKGHERVQIFADHEEPFDDRCEVRNALVALGDPPVDGAGQDERRAEAGCRRQEQAAKET